MKRLLRAGLLGAALAALLSVSAFAADTDYGITDFAATKDTVTASLKTASGGSVDAVEKQDSDNATHQFAPGAVRFDLTFADTGITVGKQYLVMVLNRETTAPTADDIVFIDQTTSAAGSVKFDNVYPSLSAGKTYHVYLSSNEETGAPVTGLTEVASFTYRRDPSMPWSLGDVNMDNKINSDDALRILESAVGRVTLTDEQKSLGDVNHDDKINSDDALYILEAAVGRRTL